MPDRQAPCRRPECGDIAPGATVAPPAPLARIVLGTAQLGMDYGIGNRTGRPRRGEADRILERAFEAGIRLLDTAPAYGASEDIIGDFLARHPQSPFGVVSKLEASLNTADAPVIIGAVERSRERLGGKLAAVLLHDAAGLQHWAEGLGAALRRCIAEGLVEAVGVSVYTPEEFATALAIDGIRIIQAPFNALDRRLLDRGLLTRARERGKEVVVRSAYLQGLLLMAPEDLPANMRFAAGALARWRGVCARHREPVDGAALKFVAAAAPGARIAVGCETLAQLERNIEILRDGPLADACLTEIRSLPPCEARLADPSRWP